MAKKVITISREFGSGGRTIGKMVAEKLGYKFYDAEIIDRVIEKSGLSREIVEKYDEYATHKSSFLYSIAINSVNASTETYHGTSFASQVHIAQIKVINEIAEEGNCVIIGRGADYILRDRDDVLNVFVYADMKFKCDRVLSLYGETDKKIEDRIKDKDTKRRVFYRSFAMREWGVYQNYHMMLDSGTVGLDRCIDMICDVAK
ncbi:MAG: cytidylate kinase-like family protein [Ruminococcaceae bacterium]|nr:cytidylate kinase-like family protein [Oscillospiraceae bacterium]